MIRKIEEQQEQNENDNPFEGEVVIYKGKRWSKEPTIEKE